MKGFTDIHSHILYKVDDGARSIENSVEILKKEYEQGVENVILTPHFHAGECMPGTDRVREHYENIKLEAKKLIPEMKIYLGNEIMACNDMVEMLEQKKLFTLADSRYVLVEFYPSVQYSEIEKTMSNLLNGGYIPIIAHCERYKCLRNVFKVINVNYIGHLVEMGAYMQVNSSSVFGRDHKFVEKLADYDFVHFIASDVHNLSTRGVHWDKCIKYLKKKYNKKYIEWLLIENPQKVLAGEYI